MNVTIYLRSGQVIDMELDRPDAERLYRQLKNRWVMPWRKLEIGSRIDRFAAQFRKFQIIGIVPHESKE